MEHPALPCPDRLELPAEGPLPPLFTALVRISGVTYGAGLHNSVAEAETTADVLAGLHPNLVSLGGAELVTVEWVSEIASLHDALSRSGGLGQVA